jgi:ABC-type phosphate/phosphonate transport system ATPase subunit
MQIRLGEVGVHFERTGIQALRAVSLVVRDGEQVAIVGASGSGKSTLLRTISGAVTFTGDASVGEHDPSTSDGSTTIRRGTGVVRQGGDLVVHLSGAMNAVMGTAGTWTARDWVAVGRGRCPQRFEKRFVDLIQRYDMGDFIANRVIELSGGQRQRVAVVRALLPTPSLLLADEPTNGLDPSSAEQAVGGLRDCDGATLLMTTHDVSVALQFPRIIGLRQGRVVFDGAHPSPDDVARIYRHDDESSSAA